MWSKNSPKTEKQISWKVFKSQESKLIQANDTIKKLRKDIQKHKRKIPQHIKSKKTDNNFSNIYFENESKPIKPGSLKNRIRNKINNAIEAILDILKNFKSIDANTILNKVISSNDEYDTYVHNKYFNQIKSKHNKSVLKYDIDDTNALKTYLINSAAGVTQQGYNSLSTLNKYQNIWENRVRKQSSSGLYIGSSSTWSRGLNTYKFKLENNKKLNIDLMCCVLYFESNQLKWDTYETNKELKQIISRLNNDNISFINGELRRNPLAFLLHITPHITVINDDRDEICANFTMDGASVQGDARGKSIVSMCYRVPVPEIYSHGLENMALMTNFYCKENDPILRDVVYTYYTKLIKIIESKKFQFNNYDKLIRFTSTFMIYDII